MKTRDEVVGRIAQYELVKAAPVPPEVWNSLQVRALRVAFGDEGFKKQLNQSYDQLIKELKWVLDE